MYNCKMMITFIESKLSSAIRIGDPYKKRYVEVQKKKNAAKALFVEVWKMKVLGVCPRLYETFQYDSLVLCACINCKSLALNMCTLAPGVIYGQIKFPSGNSLWKLET